MHEVTVTFRECHQDSQDYGSDDEHMVSRVFFSIEIDGQAEGDFHSDLKQTVGDDFETGAIEVGQPVGYDGPFNHVEFSKAAESYFRSLVGSTASGIKIGGAKHVRMRNNRFSRQTSFTFNVA